MLALAAQVPHGMLIVPVYLRATTEPASVRFRVVECRFPDPHDTLPALNDLEPARARDVVVPLPRSRKG